MKVNSGVNLWNKAKKIIPGGTQLLSKRSERFLPGLWPAYFKKAKGVNVWDLDGNKYIDMSYMGIGACVLGYADPDVNRAVKKVIDAGSMSTLNSPEDIELVELLLKIDPWAGMVRLGRSGGEACAIAIRIARAYTGKDKVAFCGYHGWHDWYLAANLADDKNLDGQLLPGLKPKGVPRGLKGTAIPFNYNKIEELQKIVKENDIGVIIMEAVREHEPENDFLKKVREVADKIKAVLIFDEITSGYRVKVGGAFQKYNVVPDIVVYGKAMGNGFPISAVVGKSVVMDAAQETFISSTFWTERIGPAAAISTIKKFQKENVAHHLIKMGERITKGWEKAAVKHGLKLETHGIAPLTSFSLQYGNDSQALQTLFNQEMLKKSYLVTKAVYLCLAHNIVIIDKYLKEVDQVFAVLRKAIDNGNVRKLLKGDIATSDFKRLT